MPVEACCNDKAVYHIAIYVAHLMVYFKAVQHRSDTSMNYSCWSHLIMRFVFSRIVNYASYQKSIF